MTTTRHRYKLGGLYTAVVPYRHVVEKTTGLYASDHPNAERIGTVSDGDLLMYLGEPRYGLLHVLRGDEIGWCYAQLAEITP